MNTNEKLYFITKKGFKIYPKIKVIGNVNRLAVCIIDENNLIYKKKENVGEFMHTTKTINSAIELALNHVYNKLN
jgi:hypothetical protein